MRRLALAALFLACVALGRAAEEALPDGLYAKITVPEGVIVCHLEDQKARLPVLSFVGLAEGTLGPAPRKPFFNGLSFHRVVPNFVIQGGDPLGTGEGDPGYKFPDQFSPGLRHGRAGILSMANDGPDTNGSQFFITLKDTNRLNYLHSVFGETVQGLEVLPLVKQGDKMKVEILRIGPSARAFKADEAAFEAAKKAVPAYSAAADPGPTADFDDPDKLLPEDPPRAKAFNWKLGNFERTTGIKIRVRLLKNFTPSTEASNAQAETKLLAHALKTDQDAVLAVYYANLDYWDLWIGDQWIGAFVGKPGTTEDLLAKGFLHQAKHGFLDQAHVQAMLYTQEAIAQLPKDKPLTVQQRLKYQVDAVVDGLIDRLNPP